MRFSGRATRWRNSDKDANYSGVNWFGGENGTGRYLAVPAPPPALPVHPPLDRQTSEKSLRSHHTVLHNELLRPKSRVVQYLNRQEGTRGSLFKRSDESYPLMESVWAADGDYESSLAGLASCSSRRVERSSSVSLICGLVHTKFHCRQAHAAGSDTSCLTFSYDGVTLASRGGDDTLKTWDMRNFRKPLAAVSGLTSFFPMTDCCFSPDDKLLLTGTSVKKDEGNGKLLFFERESLQKVYEIEVADTSIVRCLWHPKLNQIMVGTGNGLAKVYYDPVKSQRGAMLCVVKSKRKERHAETLTQDYIITPHALPMFREARQRSTRKQLEKDRLDPVRSHKPEPPVSGPGRGGRVAAHGGTLSSYIVKNIALDKTDDSNPREAILRHAKEAAENPYWVAPAYKNS
ncbi:WD repeat-containing protein 70 [Labeo rohita]|uniref:WD repeat-containing protein 70 n=1 Tax=Labeo rohita TaxID=84645 RepID=A0ABQ8MBC3_LABRO|nr:WD repeat-containing protein 70 [Labeo rohita]